MPTQLTCVLLLLTVSCSSFAETVEILDRTFTIPDGYQLSLALHPGLSERPIVVDLDAEGHLYVAESSGTNDNVQKQLEDKPHSLLRLSDTNDDGVFDQRTVFADNMMFPEGVLCHRGSVYVSAPPQIWKLTDTNADGIADKREVWLDAKTLTGCANDLHGPYAGLDGWIYWCKGAFAEQTYRRADGTLWKTRAAHIFRRRPEGGVIESVMNGGMDNPVEVAFTAAGERIFTTTFFQHPANGQRDGLVHAIYGGLYGKRHGVIDDHVRTGELMPVMTHLGAAAPSGLTRLESDSLGLRGQLVTACFNLHSVTKHELVPHGSTYQTHDSDLVSSNDLDFHPTDVIEDADGSLLIVDTGGWYKLCCPTSQLHKPDVPGAIYRLTRRGKGIIEDPRGTRIDWSGLSAPQLADLLGDARFAVRNRAMEQLANVGSGGVPAIRSLLGSGSSPATKQRAIWTLCRINSATARAAVRRGLQDDAAEVRHAAAHAVGIWRDEGAANGLRRLLRDHSMHVRRASAEALGRLRVEEAIPWLLDTLNEETDRVLEHSLIYALIEINSPEKLRPFIAHGSLGQKRAAMIALHGMSDDLLRSQDVAVFLIAEQEDLRLAAAGLAAKLINDGGKFAQVLRDELAKHPHRVTELADCMGVLSKLPEIAKLIEELLISPQTTTNQKTALLNHTIDSRQLDSALLELLRAPTPNLTRAAVRHVARRKHALEDPLARQLELLAKSESIDVETRLLAARELEKVDDELFMQLVNFVDSSQPARLRSLASNTLQRAKLTQSQLLKLAESLRFVGPLELNGLLEIFLGTTDTKLGQAVFASLVASQSISAIPYERIAQLSRQLEEPSIAEPLLTKLLLAKKDQTKHLQELLSGLPAGNIRNGQRIFHNDKLACFTCHAIGYRGGNVGPDLSRIGKTRSRRDLLEAIVYPNASFVRSYEPVTVITNDGSQWSGTIRDQSSETLQLQLNATILNRCHLKPLRRFFPARCRSCHRDSTSN